MRATAVGAAATFVALAAGACVCACYEGYSTSSYAIAGGFAAAAGAMQIAESASHPPSSGSCSLQTCGGCCDAKGACLSGAGDSACGAGGGTCADCTLLDARCAGGACDTGDPGSFGTSSASPSNSANAPACEIASCPRCALGTPCCSAVGVCACSIGNLCP